MQRSLLLISVFICGACVMILELVGSRILAPFMGTSITVWTSLIGIILGSMSLGYTYGGKLADKKPNKIILSTIIGAAGIFITITGLVKNMTLLLITELITHTTIQAILATITLFAIPSFTLAMISPYAIKLSIVNLNDSGKTAGNIYALSTLGSITGTFTAGLILIPTFGNTTILFAISAILILLSVIIYIPVNYKQLNIARIIALLVALCFATQNINSNNLNIAFENILYETDTQYNKIMIQENEDIRYMITDNALSSAKYINSDELVFSYTKFYNLFEHFKPDAQQALAIGGAGYSYPQYFTKHYPEKKIDVVEIDPKTTELARKYFDLKDNPNMKIFHQDARIFINNNQKKYDVVFGDAFSAITPPFQLTTKEANDLIYKNLTNDGIYIVNIIDSVDETSKFFPAYYQTLLETFPQVLIFRPQQEKEPSEKQNITIVALKTPTTNLTSSDTQIQALLNCEHNKIPKATIILTDEHAPVEALTQ